MQKLTETIRNIMKPVWHENTVELMQAYSFQEIMQYMNGIRADEILFIRDAFMMNMEILEEGLQSSHTILGPKLKKENDGRMISENEKRTVQLFCGGTLEAWVCGVGKPVMSLGGNGVCGIISTMPLFAYQQVHRDLISADKLLYATSLSYLVTLYLMRDGTEQEKASGVGMACGLCYIKGGNVRQIEKVKDTMMQMALNDYGERCVSRGIYLVDIAFGVVQQVMQEMIGEC